MRQKSTLSKMTILPSKKPLEFTPGESVLDVALRNQLKLSHSCGGMGSCGTCRVYVRSDLGQLEERSELEKEMSKDRKFRAEERLGCQTKAYEGLIVEVPKRHLT